MPRHHTMLNLENVHVCLRIKYMYVFLILVFRKKNDIIKSITNNEIFLVQCLQKHFFTIKIFSSIN